MANGPLGGGGHEPGPLARELGQRFEALWPSPPTLEPARTRSPLAVGDGRGVVFVSHVGEVLPSGFLPLAVGNVREQPLSAIYASAPLLAALRDPGRLRGRCGRCELRTLCGGSRAQAWARTGDVFAGDPTCAYDPAPIAGAERRDGAFLPAT